MSILSIFESKTAKSKKPGATYVQQMTSTKNPSKLLGEAKTVSKPPLSDVSKFDSDYNLDKITKYIK